MYSYRSSVGFVQRSPLGHRNPAARVLQQAPHLPGGVRSRAGLHALPQRRPEGMAFGSPQGHGADREGQGTGGKPPARLTSHTETSSRSLGHPPDEPPPILGNEWRGFRTFRHKKIPRERGIILYKKDLFFCCRFCSSTIFDS